MLRDTAFTRQMKEEILRRVAEQSDSEDELEADLNDRGRRGATAAFEEELDGEFVSESAKVKVAGDGEGSGSEDEAEEPAEQVCFHIPAGV